MRGALKILLLGVLVVARPASAEEENAPAARSIKSQTTVRGTAPSDLVGRWLALGWIKLPNGRTRTVPSFWKVTRAGTDLVLTVHFAWLPAAQQDAVTAANKSGEPWRPSAGDLKAVAASWEQLPPWRGSTPTAVESEIAGRDAFDDELRNDATTSGAAWAVRNTYTFPPKVASTVQQVDVYGVLAASDGGYSGRYKTFVIAAAPFLVPVNFEGTFQLYRVDARRGVLARLLDLFSGCRGR